MRAWLSWDIVKKITMKTIMMSAAGENVAFWYEIQPNFKSKDYQNHCFHTENNEVS